MSTTPVTCGIDVGSLSTKVVLGPALSCEIVRNQVGDHATPTAVSFGNHARQVGATANKKDGLIMLNRFLAGEGQQDGLLKEFDVIPGPVEYRGAEQIFEPAAILAMLLGNVRESVIATVERVSGKSVAEFDLSYALVVGPDTAPEAQQELLDAAFAGGMSNAFLVESSQSYGQTLERKFPVTGERTVLLIDMGHMQTTISLIQLGKKETEVKEIDDEEADEQPTVKVVTSLRNKSLGALSIDARLWHHFQATIPALKHVTPKSRSGQRLLDGCQKLKHLLSQLNDGTVTVENIQDTDVKLTLSRQTLTELCQAEANALSELIHSAVDGVDTIDVVEVVGGGCRVPWVKNVILNSVPRVETLSFSLDDTSCAMGAALLLTDCKQQDTGVVGASSTDASSEDLERREKLLQAEQSMALYDKEMHALSETKNKIESHVLEMRSARNGKHSELLPESLDSYLDDLDNWIFSEEVDKLSKAEMEQKLKHTLDETRELCKAYFDAVKKEQEEKEKEMEEEAKRAQIERDGEEEDLDDHDNRRLPKKRRMEIVMKNKTEANELFSDGNFKFAAARYAKALSHCAKFVDLSPEDLTEVNGIKLSLNLNLALAYFKLENYDQALRVCNDALELDPDSAKALYRRASVYYEKKNWEAASKDIKKASSLAENDKAIMKLQERIDVQVKRQKEREKKMAKKMFG